MDGRQVQLTLSKRSLRLGGESEGKSAERSAAPYLGLHGPLYPELADPAHVSDCRRAETDEANAVVE